MLMQNRGKGTLVVDIARAIAVDGISHSTMDKQLYVSKLMHKIKQMLHDIGSNLAISVNSSRSVYYLISHDSPADVPPHRMVVYRADILHKVRALCSVMKRDKAAPCKYPDCRCANVEDYVDAVLEA